MDKKKIDEALIDFGIVPIDATSERKYSEHAYRHFQKMAETFGVKEPKEVIKSLLDNNPKPYVTQYVLYGYPEKITSSTPFVFPAQAGKTNSLASKAPPTFPITP